MKKAAMILCLNLCLQAVVVSVAFAAAVTFSVAGGRFSGEVKSYKEIKTENIVAQSHDYSCGPAAIATILSYYFNEPVTEAEIIKFLLLTTNIEKVKENKGFSLLDLKKFAQSKGYETTGYQMDFEFLVNLNRPVLVPINIREYHHFVVFRGLKGDRVFIADPVLGQMTMRYDKFLGIWKGGIGLVLSKSGREYPDSALSMSRQEEVFYADSSFVQRIISDAVLGNVLLSGEF